MNLVTVDLGDTTGWAWFEDGVWQSAGTKPLGAVLRYLINNFSHIDTVVLERPALVETGKKANEYAEVVASFAVRYKKKLQMVRPTDWKQRYGTYPLPGRGVLKTKHERDAYRIGIWYMEKNK